METDFRPKDVALSGTGPFIKNTSLSPTWHQRISWPAVFAGFIVAVLTQLALTLLGVAIGMSAVDVVKHDTPGTGLAVASGIWSAVSIIISLFAGGWVAGRLAKDKHTSESMIHGLLVAGLLFILTFYLVSSLIGNTLGSAENIMENAVNTVTPSITREVQKRYESNPENLSADKAKLNNAISNNKREAEQKARQIADDVASGTGKAALYSFIGILLGTGAAAFGAKLGRDSKIPDDYHTHHLQATTAE